MKTICFIMLYTTLYISIHPGVFPHTLTRTALGFEPTHNPSLTWLSSNVIQVPGNLVLSQQTWESTSLSPTQGFPCALIHNIHNSEMQSTSNSPCLSLCGSPENLARKHSHAGGSLTICRKWTGEAALSKVRDKGVRSKHGKFGECSSWGSPSSQKSALCKKSFTLDAMQQATLKNCLHVVFLAKARKSWGIRHQEWFQDCRARKEMNGTKRYCDLSVDFNNGCPNVTLQMSYTPPHPHKHPFGCQISGGGRLCGFNPFSH